MATAIMRLATHEAEWVQFSTNAKEAFRSHFTLQAMVDTYMNLYRNIPKIRALAL
jgi:hypothetical protein